MFNRKEGSEVRKQNVVGDVRLWDIEKKKNLFIRSFLHFCMDDVEKRENVSVKRERPTLEKKFKNIDKGISITGDIAGVLLEGASAVPFIPSIGTTVEKGVFKPARWAVKLIGMRIANKKAKSVAESMLVHDKEELELMLQDVARDLAIAFEYQLSCLSDIESIGRLSAAGVGRLFNYLSNRDADKEELDINKEVLLRGVITGEFRNIGLKVYIAEDCKIKEWKTEDVFLKVGLFTKEGKYCSHKDSEPEVYGYRTELSKLLDSGYEVETEPRDDIYYKSYTPRVQLVPVSDLVEYADKRRNKNPDAVDKTFNEYVSYKYKLNKEVTAACRNQELIRSDLSGGDFSGSDFSGLKLRKCDLSKAKLNHTYLKGIILEEVDLREAELKEAFALDARMKKVNLKGSNLYGANLAYSTLHEIKANRDTILIKVTGTILNREVLEKATTDENMVDQLRLLSKRVERKDKTVRKIKEMLEKQQGDYGKKGNEVTTDLGIQAYDPIGAVSHYYESGSTVLLEEALLNKSTVILAGIAGSGKTQLARHYAEQYHMQDPSKIVYELSGESLGGFERGYRELAVLLTKEAGIKKAPIKDVKRVVLRELAKQENEGFVLILDNIDDPKVKKRLDRYIPQNIKNNGKIIITTQDSTLSFYLDSVRLPMLGWSEDEACLFLLTHLKDKLPEIREEEIRLLTGVFDNIPLGVDAARLYIKKYRISIGRYLEELEKEGGEVEKREDKLMQQHYNKERGENNIRAAIRLARKKVLEGKGGKEAIEVLNFCSFLNSDSIPIWLLANRRRMLQEGESLIASERKIIDSIENLEKLSMISNQSGIDDKRVIYLHRIVQEVSRSLLTQEEREQYISEASDILSQHIARDNNTSDKYDRNQVVVPHVESLLLNAAKYKIKFTPAMIYFEISRGVFYGFIGEHERANRVLSEQREQIESLLGADDLLDVGKVYTKLKGISRDLPTLYAQVLYHLGRSCMSISLEDEESKKYLEDAVSIRDLIDQAIKEDKEYEDIDKKYNEGKPRPMDSTIFRRGGVILWYNLRGYKEHNIEYLDNALKEYDYLLQKEKYEYPNELKDKFNQGFCRIGIADINVKIAALTQAEEERVKLCEEALEVACDHLREGLNMEIGKDVSQLTSKTLYEKLEWVIKTSSNTRVAREYELLGKIFQVRGMGDDLEYAEKFFIRAKELDSSKSHLTGNVLYGLACIYKKQGRVEEAKTSLEECIEVRTKVDPKMIYEAKDLLNEITPQEHVHKQEGMVEHIKGKEKADDIKPSNKSPKETRLERVRGRLLREIQSKSLEPGREEVEIRVIGTAAEIEACCTELGINKKSLKIEEQEKEGDSNQRSTVYLNIKVLEQIRERFIGKEIGK
ncbi:pentapeptide repeat-containing protein [Candidatus Jidaibacter acanthamoebae]|nr:pentapeptide repeat-containing protein [Candidatus Jidaibacter acanthamoeba]